MVQNPEGTKSYAEKTPPTQGSCASPSPYCYILGSLLEFLCAYTGKYGISVESQFSLFSIQKVAYFLICVDFKMTFSIETH